MRRPGTALSLLACGLAGASGCFDFGRLGTLYPPPDLAEATAEDLASVDAQRDIRRADRPLDAALDRAADDQAPPDLALADRPLTDGAVDGAAPDLSMAPDLSVAIDLALPADLRDLAVVDRPIPDLGGDLVVTDSGPPDLLPPAPIQGARLRWTRAYSHTSPLYAVWVAPGLNDIYAVGFGTILHAVKGAAWANDIVPAGDTYFAVRGRTVGPARVIAAGVNMAGFPTVQRVDQGRQWFGAQIAAKGSVLHGIWQESAGDFTVVGTGGFVARGPGIGAWTTPAMFPLAAHLFAATGTLSRLYAGGATGSLAITDDGKSWTSDDALTTQTIQGATTSPPGDVYLVGDGNLVRVHLAGAVGWEKRDVPMFVGGISLHDVFAPAGDLVYAVGGAGYVLYSRDQGKSWEKEVQLPIGLIEGIHGSDGVVYLVTAGGLIYRGE